ncbi:MAG: pyridoxamine 5'-phosphate oxidase [Bacteroidetes bacterium]|nr:pyridoxamine 5'-phosphate oxidase [Bacteroidota bacterium]
MDLGELRKNYTQGGLTEEDLNKDPFEQFEFWFKQAVDTEVNEPNAMCLATSSKNYLVTVRTVLLKMFDRKGFVFFTNYESVKSKQIEENPNVSAVFPWLDLERQVIITGPAEKVSTGESLKYFATRPRGSQLGAWISHQSSVITSRSLLEMKLEEMKRKFMDKEVPLPDFWGGYRIVPKTIEFWQGRPNRLHDRFKYTLQEDGIWTTERLAP